VGEKMNEWYTQREWDRVVGLGKVPEEYTKTGSKMTFDEYQEFAKTTAIYPDNAKVVYPTLGLSGEAGEVAEKVKKNIRKSKFGSFEFYGNELDDIAKELGDVLWYVSALATDIGYSLEDIAQMNVEKLKSRQERNKIEGEGDNR
jgi:NTP pyrophosphatase (non-canonical NTP hydrolase)|tara:strand:- start:961 stop:1395 length:435 start_codon:yes stop_codon:yes gene_type:complete